MRIDIVSIFPDYLSPLRLSLIGKALDRGLLDIRVHDLRDWATDLHRTVDDTPYGGGAGMVMLPEIWGRALDSLLADDANATTRIVFTTPAGSLFTQSDAVSWATESRLIFCCGRYEGIDARVPEYYRQQGQLVSEVSIGDYVLNGGEVAALVMIEAVTRLAPGVIGNPASLIEESHSEPGLLEYPNFTKPQEWRGLEVPAELLTGHHRNIAQWRRAAALARTQKYRPELLEHPAGI